MLGTEIIEGKCEGQLAVKRQNQALPSPHFPKSDQKTKKEKTFGPANFRNVVKICLCANSCDIYFWTNKILNFWLN